MSKPTQNNYRRIRILIGSLGMMLPLVLPLKQSLVNYFKQTDFPTWLPSISHYNYSYGSVIFTGVLSAFGLMLISYKGFRDDRYCIKDDTLTTFAGLAALIVALVPTVTGNADGLIHTPNHHDCRALYFVHLISAGVFLVLLGCMSIFKFTLGTTQDTWHRRRKFLYKLLGWFTILPILTLALLMPLDLAGDNTVFIAETVALIAFGLSWLLKGKASFFVLLGLISRKELAEAREGDGGI